MSFIYKPEDPAKPAATGAQPLRVALQPNTAVAGWPADSGSNALTGYKPLEDATIVARLRSSGATIPGYTAMSEFGFSRYKSTAGKALAENAADAEIVPDLLGEARLAAIQANACCLKPGFGALSRFGINTLMPSLDCNAIIAAAPQTIRHLFERIQGSDQRDPSMPAPCAERKAQSKKGRITLGVIDNLNESLEPKLAAAFAARVKQLGDNGIIIRHLTLPEFPLYATAHQIIGCVEASSAAGRYDSVRFGARPAGAKNWNEMFLSARGDAFGPLIKTLLLQGALFQFERRQAYDDACRIRARLVASFNEALETADALLLPVAATPPPAAAPTLAQTYHSFAATLPANLTGAAALTLPPRDGVAPQLLSGRGDNLRLLAIGEHLLGI